MATWPHAESRVAILWRPMYSVSYFMSIGMQLEELLVAELGAKEYDTETQGLRHEVAAHGLGEGEPRVWGVPCRPSCVLAGTVHQGLGKPCLQWMSNGVPGKV